VTHGQLTVTFLATGPQLVLIPIPLRVGG